MVCVGAYGSKTMGQTHAGQTMGAGALNSDSIMQGRYVR